MASEPTSARSHSLAESPIALLMGIHVLAYAAMLLVGGRGELRAISTRTLMTFGASYAPLVRDGQVFRLATSMFLHVNPLHLFMNSVALLSIGPMVERDYGRQRFVAIYVATGLLGAVTSVIWHLGHPAVSAGASGAICGAIAAGAVSSLFAQRSRESRALLVWAAITLLFGALIHADNAAHLGGLVSGALLGLVLHGKTSSRSPSALPTALLLGLALVSFGFAVRFRSRSETAPELVNRGVELAQAGDLDGALVRYERAIALEPKSAVAHFDLGLALEHQGDFASAIRELGRAFELEPSETHRRALAGAHVNHGVALAKNGDYVGAIVAYRSALGLEDGNANAHRNLGLALQKTSDLPGAVAELRRAAEIDASPEMKDTLASLLVDHADALAADGKHDDAIARYREAAGVAPDEWRAHYGLGIELMRKKDPDAAVTALERAWGLERSELVQRALVDAIEARRDARADKGNLAGALDDIEKGTLLGLKRPGAPADAGADAAE